MIIYPAKLSGTIDAPPSKSMAHRAIICAALADGESTLSNIELSEDIVATFGAVRGLGAIVDIIGNEKIKSLQIKGLIKKTTNNTPLIDCNESGSTLRFMIPVSLAAAGMGRFEGRGRLPDRPVDTYRKLFEQKGIEWIQGVKSLPLEIKGKIKNGTYDIPGNISSQYITGLLLALPLIEGDSIIKVIGVLESEKYVDMTIEVMEAFGVKVIKKDNIFLIQGNQSNKAREYKVEGDWSQAAFLILAGVLGKGTKICGLNKNSSQGDIAILNILTDMGADLSWDGDVLQANPSKLTAAKADVSQCPDLAPAIALAMSVAEGESQITGGQRLKIKESDRIMSVANALNALGAKVSPTEDGMIIEGVKKLGGGTANAAGDHRIAMMSAVASALCENETNLIGKDSVNKSYPSFWEDFVFLGGKIL